MTVVDRKSKFTLIQKVTSKRAEEVTKALISILKPSPVTMVKSLLITNKYLDTDFYFAHPYASWERGLNKHTNGLIRQSLPKSYLLD